MGNNISEVTEACKPCCEEEMLSHSSPSKNRPLGFDEQWKEEVCAIEPIEEFAPPHQQQESIENSNKRPEKKQKASHQGQALFRLEFALHQGNPFGLQLTETREPQGTGLLVIVQVEKRSPFARTVDGRLGVAAGDTIVEVNGQRGSASHLRDMLQQLVAFSGDCAISLTLRSRPAAFDVALEREGPLWRKLGLAVAIDKTKQDCLIVQNVRNEGLVSRWNAEHGSCRVCVGDLITQVNCIKHNAPDMCAAITAATMGAKLHFRVATTSQTRERDSTCMERFLAPPGSSDVDTSLCENNDKAKPDETSDISTTITDCVSGFSRTPTPDLPEAKPAQ